MPDPAQALRRRYAARIARIAGVADARLEAAYAAVRREDFCGPPPWRVSGAFTVEEGGLDSLYDDVLVTIDARRGINNGQPSLHAASIAALALKAGETVVQIGAGTGYYTAILAHLVGPTGKAIAYEIEADLAERARSNLACFPQAEVRLGSGAGEGLPKADAVYVNCAATHPVRAWLDALNPGGRLLFPLQAAQSTGAMLLLTRPPSDADAWPAKLMSGVVFIACEGAQDAAIGRKLDEAFRRSRGHRVRWLRFGATPPDETVWLQGEGWTLTAASEPAGAT